MLLMHDGIEDRPSQISNDRSVVLYHQGPQVPVIIPGQPPGQVQPMELKTV